ncbi:protein FAM107B-like isoform X1 [Lates japonicus]|uniref:Protein FAM107B-like isoform X1 n=1 Tax=Lates japonicus TaxID=270547 RepID=A0AAD3NIZ6_LATJO|nr:protein FAM107B-like isoform X1 [Lates japonicus]
MSLNGSFPNNNNHTHMDIQLASSCRMMDKTHPQSNNHRKDNAVKAEACSGHQTPSKLSGLTMSFTRNCYHSVRDPNYTVYKPHIFDFSTMPNSSCFLYGLRGLHRAADQNSQVLERRKRVQSDQEEEGQSRTLLEDVLLRRQQKQLECQCSFLLPEGEGTRGEGDVEEAQLMEFVRVRDRTLRKIHQSSQNKAKF